jgi:hypothetical protein
MCASFSLFSVFDWLFFFGCQCFYVYRCTVRMRQRLAESMSTMVIGLLRMLHVVSCVARPSCSESDTVMFVLPYVCSNFDFYCDTYHSLIVG